MDKLKYREALYVLARLLSPGMHGMSISDIEKRVSRLGYGFIMEKIRSLPELFLSLDFKKDETGEFNFFFDGKPVFSTSVDGLYVIDHNPGLDSEELMEYTDTMNNVMYMLNTNKVLVEKFLKDLTHE
jgi:hypothetical protein